MTLNLPPQKFKKVIFDLDGTLALIDDRRKISTKPNGKVIGTSSLTLKTLVWINQIYL